MQYLKKIFIFGVSILLAFSVFACSNGGEDSESNESNQSDQSDQSSNDVVDLEGFEFTWATIWSWGPYPEEGQTEYGDLKLERYKEVEDKYNCKITFTPLNAVSFSADLSAATASGTKYYDFFEVDYARFQTVQTSLKPLNDLIDVNQPHFNTVVNNATTRDGKVYGLTYDFERVPSGYLMFYNKTLLDANSLDDPYDLVKSNNWTFEKFEEMATALTKSTTGGEINQWGLAGIDWNTQSIELPFLFANGGNVIKKDENDKWTFALLDDQAQETFNILNRWFYKEKILIASSPRNIAAGYVEWLQGNVGFFIGNVNYLRHVGGQGGLAGIVDSEIKLKEGTEYGIVPMPIGPSNDNYRQMSSDFYSWVMMNSNPDAEKAAVVFDAISQPVYGSYEEDYEEYWGAFKANVLNGSEEMWEMFELSKQHVVVNDEWGMPGIESRAAAVYACTRSVEKTPRAAMEEIQPHAKYWIGMFFYGLTEEEIDMDND